MDKNQFKSNLNESGAEKKVILKEYIVQDMLPCFISLGSTINQLEAFKKSIQTVCC